jgi:hypothetical protein
VRRSVWPPPAAASEGSGLSPEVASPLGMEGS